MRNYSLLLLVAAISFLSFGCTSDTTVGEDDGAASGSLRAASGRVVPASARVQVAWVVTSGSPDYTYMFGAGTSTADRFSVDLPTDPPTEALNSNGIGVGLVVLLESSVSLPDGRLADTTPLEGSLIGASGRYVIVYKEAGATNLHWTSDFPTGLSCGREDTSRVQDSFVGFEPVDCDDIEIIVDAPDNIDFTNWT